MRKTFQALLILVALLACSASTASAATVRVLKPRILSVRADWVGQVDGSTLAFGAKTAGAAAEVLADGAGVREVAAPEGCRGAAAGGGHLLFTCWPGYTPTAVMRRAVVTAADGTVQTSVGYTLQLSSADGSTPNDPDAIGAQWIHHVASCYHCDDWSVDVNWHTGEIREPKTSDLRRREDLDAPGALSPLCAPLRLNGPPGDADEFAEWPQNLGVQRSGQWALIGYYDSGSDAFPPISWRLRHCGTTKVYKMPVDAVPVALAGGFVVLTGLHDGRTELLRLRDRRVFALPGVQMPINQVIGVAATAHRLLIRGDIRSSALLWSVALPQR
jgi:hypothetical protein